MENQKQYKAVTDGNYVLCETNNRNEFIFYRKDGQEIGNVGTIPLQMFNWMMLQNFKKNNSCPKIIIDTISMERFRDNKSLKLTVIWYDMDEEV